MEEFGLDERMTDETKLHVLKTLDSFKSRKNSNFDIEKLRKLGKIQARDANSSLKFDKLNIHEIKINNKMDDYEIPVSIYKPDDIIPNSPITIFYHGGGWTFGCRESYHYSVASLAESTKTIWLSVEYRLCPENKFPIPLTDCQSVLEYVYDNKVLFSCEDAKLLICGDSAGGHFSALLSNDFSHLIDAQILIYPVLNFKGSYQSENEFARECFLLVPSLSDWFIANLLKNETFINSPAIAPILKEDFSRIPKTLLIAAELDRLVDHSRHYHKRLQENNVSSTLTIIKGAVHHFFCHPVLMKNAFSELQKEIINFYNNL